MFNVVLLVAVGLAAPPRSPMQVAMGSGNLDGFIGEFESVADENDGGDVLFGWQDLSTAAETTLGAASVSEPRADVASEHVGVGAEQLGPETERAWAQWWDGANDFGAPGGPPE